MKTNILHPITRFAGPIVLGLIVVIGAVLALLAMPASETLAHETKNIGTQAVTKTAYVVVRYGDNDVDVRLIAYTGTISEWTALELAGLNPVGYVHPTWGLALCGINGVGQVNGTNDGCDNGFDFWGTKDVNDEGNWEDNLGVSTTFSDDGHVSGFVWGSDWPSANPPAGSQMTSAAAGLTWLRKQQDADGGYGDIGSSTELLLAVAANGCDPGQWHTEGGQSLLDYIEANGESFTDKASSTGKLMVGLSAAGEDVTTFFPGGSLVATMTGYYNSTTGAYDSGTAYDQGSGPHSWAVLGIRAAGQSVPVKATEYLTGNMQTEGCWEWQSGFGCDTNSTALAIQAMIATGVATDATEVISGVTWLKSRQNSDGGFPYSSGDSDSNSTAYVIQALLAAGESLDGLANGTPIDYLRDRQQSSGQIYWQDDAPGFGTASTRQAVPPLVDTPFPISRVAGLTACPLTEIMNYYYLPIISKN